MFASLIERTAMGLVAGVLAAIGAVFVLIGSFTLLSAWIQPGPAALAMGGALLLVATFLLLIGKINRQPHASAPAAHPSNFAALATIQAIWKQHPLACVGLIGAAGLLLARRPKTLTDLAAIAAQFLQPTQPPKM